jgi:hypothetical protein
MDLSNMPGALTKRVSFPCYHTVDITREGKWGNPFIIGPHGSREEVIDKFEKWGISLGLDSKARTELKGETLGCHCKKYHRCHGDVLVKWANEGEHDNAT